MSSKGESFYFCGILSCMRSTENFNKLLPTAFLTAYPRTFTDIPYSEQIFSALEDIKRVDGIIFGDDILSKNLAPGLEAHYKMVDKLLGNLGFTQVLELAAGLSPRGVIFTENNAQTRYVELDLPEMAQLKREVFSRCGIMPTDNLHICSGSALAESDIDEAVSHFDPRQPVAIVSEGLLPYFGFEEKSILARHIVSVLEKFGGYWVSNDAPAVNGLNRVKRVAKQASVRPLVSTKNFSPDLFDDLDHFVRFFEAFGLEVVVHDLEEVLPLLTSPVRLGLDKAETRRKLSEYSSVAVMRLRTDVSLSD